MKNITKVKNFIEAYYSEISKLVILEAQRNQHYITEEGTLSFFSADTLTNFCHIESTGDELLTLTECGDALSLHLVNSSKFITGILHNSPYHTDRLTEIIIYLEKILSEIFEMEVKLNLRIVSCNKFSKYEKETICNYLKSGTSSLAIKINILDRLINSYNIEVSNEVKNIVKDKPEGVVELSKRLVISSEYHKILTKCDIHLTKILEKELNNYYVYYLSTNKEIVREYQQFLEDDIGAVKKTLMYIFRSYFLDPYGLSDVIYRNIDKVFPEFRENYFFKLIIYNTVMKYAVKRPLYYHHNSIFGPDHPFNDAGGFFIDIKSTFDLSNDIYYMEDYTTEELVPTSRKPIQAKKALKILENFNKEFNPKYIKENDIFKLLIDLKKVIYENK